MSKKIGKGGGTVVETLPDGSKRSIQVTPAGVRVNRHFNGVTVSEDPGAIGVKGAFTSTVGGGNPRVTVEQGGVHTDFTRRDDRSVDEVDHHRPVAVPKK